MGKLYDGISTREIYRHAYRILKKKEKKSAGKYHLKQALMQLGPTGFPFEKFISELLKAQGFSVKVGQIVSGKCVNHEIDIIAERKEKHFMVECKFHNAPGITCDVKIPLYIHARFKDVEAEWIKIPGHGVKFHQGWLVTNTRFTGDAVMYGNCCGLYLLGWDYPRNESLKDMIDSLGMYPVTCLTSITLAEKQKLLHHGVILCKEIFSQPQLLVRIGLSRNRVKLIIEEANSLCENQE